MALIRMPRHDLAQPFAQQRRGQEHDRARLEAVRDRENARPNTNLTPEQLEWMIDKGITVADLVVAGTSGIRNSLRTSDAREAALDARAQPWATATKGGASTPAAAAATQPTAMPGVQLRQAEPETAALRDAALDARETVAAPAATPESRAKEWGEYLAGAAPDPGRYLATDVLPAEVVTTPVLRARPAGRAETGVSLMPMRDMGPYGVDVSLPPRGERVSSAPMPESDPRDAALEARRRMEARPVPSAGATTADVAASREALANVQGSKPLPTAVPTEGPTLEEVKAALDADPNPARLARKFQGRVARNGLAISPEVRTLIDATAASGLPEIPAATPTGPLTEEDRRERALRPAGFTGEPAPVSVVAPGPSEPTAPQPQRIDAQPGVINRRGAAPPPYTVVGLGSGGGGVGGANRLEVAGRSALPLVGTSGSAPPALAGPYPAAVVPEPPARSAERGGRSRVAGPAADPGSALAAGAAGVGTSGELPAMDDIAQAEAEVAPLFKDYGPLPNTLDAALAELSIAGDSEREAAILRSIGNREIALPMSLRDLITGEHHTRGIAAADAVMKSRPKAADPLKTANLLSQIKTRESAEERAGRGEKRLEAGETRAEAAAARAAEAHEAAMTRAPVQLQLLNKRLAKIVGSGKGGGPSGRHLGKQLTSAVSAWDGELKTATGLADKDLADAEAELAAVSAEEAGTVAGVAVPASSFKGEASALGAREKAVRLAIEDARTNRDGADETTIMNTPNKADYQAVLDRLQRELSELEVRKAVVARLEREGASQSKYVSDKQGAEGTARTAKLSSRRAAAAAKRDAALAEKTALEEQRRVVKQMIFDAKSMTPEEIAATDVLPGYEPVRDALAEWRRRQGR